MQTRCSARLARSRSSQPSAGPRTAAAPGAPSGASRDSPARVSPPPGALRRPHRARSPRGLTASPPPGGGVRGAGGQQAASSEPGAGCCLASPRGRPAAGTPGRRRGALRAGAGLRFPVPAKRPAPAPSRACEGTKQRRAARARRRRLRGSAAEPLTWSQAQSPESCGEEEEPHPPGAAAAGLACSREGASEGGRQRGRRADVRGEAPRQQARSPPCPAPRRDPASPELRAETGRNCTRSESWGAAPPLPSPASLPSTM